MVSLLVASLLLISSREASQSPLGNSDSFPIAVWLQDPSNAGKYRAAGFNLYIGLWQGPTEDQLQALTKAKMPVICSQNEIGLKHLSDPIIVGWDQNDEPDNAQPQPGGGYGPCVPPANVVAEFQRLKKADPSRPVVLNLGQGIANDEWVGRGNGSSLSDYATYVKGGDIISYDIYPIAGLSKPDPENYLWYVAKGLDRLNNWMGGKGTRWNCIECTRIGGERKATPAQVRSEVWMSIIHGSRGLIYFVHQFKPNFDEHALLDDPEMLAAVTDLNSEIAHLAPIINSPDIANQVTVKSSSGQVPIDLMVKSDSKHLYIFAAGMRNGSTQGRFQVSGSNSDGAVEVVNENRTLPMVHGNFSDNFGPYGSHIYAVQK